MQKEFNDTGLCVPDLHYMVGTSKKIHRIIQLIDKGRYFTINRPRQFGKTTTISLLHAHLNRNDRYIALNISFEDIDSVTYQNRKALSQFFWI